MFTGSCLGFRVSLEEGTSQKELLSNAARTCSRRQKLPEVVSTPAGTPSIISAGFAQTLDDLLETPAEFYADQNVTSGVGHLWKVHDLTARHFKASRFDAKKGPST